VRGVTEVGGDANRRRRGEQPRGQELELTPAWCELLYAGLAGVSFAFAASVLATKRCMAVAVPRFGGRLSRRFGRFL
jgi:hypothetical protein